MRHRISRSDSPLNPATFALRCMYEHWGVRCNASAFVFAFVNRGGKTKALRAYVRFAHGGFATLPTEVRTEITATRRRLKRTKNGAAK